MNADQLAQVRNRRIGFIFPELQLLPGPRRSKTRGAAPVQHRGAAQRAQKACDANADRVGLGNRLDHGPNQLSGGQQSVSPSPGRSSTSRDPVGDEPTGNLDTSTSREIMALFRQLNETRGLTVSW